MIVDNHQADKIREGMMINHKERNIYVTILHGTMCMLQRIALCSVL